MAAKCCRGRARWGRFGPAVLTIIVIWAATAHAEASSNTAIKGGQRFYTAIAANGDSNTKKHHEGTTRFARKANTSTATAKASAGGAVKTKKADISSPPPRTTAQMIRTITPVMDEPSPSAVQQAGRTTIRYDGPADKHPVSYDASLHPEDFGSLSVNLNLGGSAPPPAATAHHRGGELPPMPAGAANSPVFPSLPSAIVGGGPSLGSVYAGPSHALGQMLNFPGATHASAERTYPENVNVDCDPGNVEADEVVRADCAQRHGIPMPSPGLLSGLALVSDSIGHQHRHADAAPIDEDLSSQEESTVRGAGASEPAAMRLEADAENGQLPSVLRNVAMKRIGVLKQKIQALQAELGRDKAEMDKLHVFAKSETGGSQNKNKGFRAVHGRLVGSDKASLPLSEDQHYVFDYDEDGYFED